jgi:hypothetical protein
MSGTPVLRRPIEVASRFAAGWTMDLLIGAILFAVSLFLFGSQGIGLSWDSNFYLWFSQLMRLNLDFSTQGLYAPLYPMLLAALTTLGASTERALVLVHATSVAIVFLASSRLVRNADLPPFLAPLAGIYGALVALGSLTFQFVWTEVPYVALLTACIAIAVGFWRGTLAPSAWWFIPLGFLAPLRFIGIFPAALLTGLMAWRIYATTRPTLPKLARLAGGFMLAFGPIVVIGVLNSMAWDCAFGCRDPSTFTLHQNLALTWSTFESEFPQFAGGVLILAVALLATLFRLRVSGAAQPNGTAQERTVWVAWAVPLAVVVVSVGAQVYASTRMDIDPINPRYFASLYPAMVIGLIVAAWRVVMARPGRLARPAFLTALIVIPLVAGYRDFALYTGLASDATDSQAALTDFGFKQSEMLRTWSDEQAALLAEDRPGGIAAYFPLTAESTNLAAYLVLDSAYGPKGARCRPGAIHVLTDGDSQVRLDCTTAHGPKQLNVAVISNLARIPQDTELLVMDKSEIQDDAADLRDVGVQHFEIVADTPSHRILRRRP